MMKIATTTIEHSAPWQLKALLALAQKSGRHGQFLPPGMEARAELARHLTKLCGGSAPSGEALLSTLCALQTPLAALQGIKELAKSLSANAESESESAAATLVYHAAVAAALARHGRNISSRDAARRYELYEDLAALMAGSPLGQVFREAAEVLAAQAASGETG